MAKQQGQGYGGVGRAGAGNDTLGLALIDSLERPSQLDPVPGINPLSPHTRNAGVREASSLLAGKQE